MAHHTIVSKPAEWVRVTSAVEGAEFQVITLQLPRNKSLQAIAAVQSASVLSVSETKVVLIATEDRLLKPVLAQPHAASKSVATHALSLK